MTETPLPDLVLTIRLDDTEEQHLHARCECGHPLGDDATLAQLGDLAGRWEQHVRLSGECALHAPERAAARRLPADAQDCDRCGARIVWARTVAGPNGRGGRAMPLDEYESARGNVAVQPVTANVLRARVLGKDEHHSPPVEYLAMPHFATCRVGATS